MRYAFVLNPAARNGRAANGRGALDKALRGANLDYALMETEQRGHGTELAREAALSYDVVVAVGGDGTVQEVMRGVLGTQAVMGILPVGTGNDFAKAIGMPKGLDAALAAMLRADTATVDMGRIRWQEKGDAGSLTVHDGAFINCVGAGFDAAAAKAAHHYKVLGGRPAYVAAVLETLWKWRKPNVEVEIWAGGFVDGVQESGVRAREAEDEMAERNRRARREDSNSGIQNPESEIQRSNSQNPIPESDIPYPKSQIQSPISDIPNPKSQILNPELTPIYSGQLFLIEIDNGFSVGGGFLLTPDAEIDDGLFDVCLVEHLSTGRALRLMPKTFSGSHIGEAEVSVFQARSVHIRAATPLPVQADGEILSAGAVSLDVEIVPGALRIRAPEIRRSRRAD